MRSLGFSLSIALLGLSGLSSTAHAHFILATPPGVVANEGNGKGPPPCGPDTGAAATPTPVQGGHPLMVKVTETVGHPGFYRVALALNSRSELPVDNVVYDKANKVLPANGMPNGLSDHADFQATPVFPVLADNFLKHTDAVNGKVYMGMVDVPNVTCNRCILQVIEFMAQHGWNGTGANTNGGYFYHHCAEVKITADTALPPFNANGTPDAGAPTDAKTDTSTGAGGTTGSAGTAGTGTAGTGGGAAGTTGAAGTAAAGTGGGQAGTTGSSTGMAGTTGAAGTTAGSRGDDGGGGCAVAGGAASLGGLLFGLGTLLAARRRRR